MVSLDLFPLTRAGQLHWSCCWESHRKGKEQGRIVSDAKTKIAHMHIKKKKEVEIRSEKREPAEATMLSKVSVKEAREQCQETETLEDQDRVAVSKATGWKVTSLSSSLCPRKHVWKGWL